MQLVEIFDLVKKNQVNKISLGWLKENLIFVHCLWTIAMYPGIMVFLLFKLAYTLKR